ncbi:type II toxin-antitoxin system VapC family toxin [Spirosoma rhododendri]|uniref:Ribonuclease VapC n=1 Tax=Spirosoma rhododendri TaxID=2728024 RepID=A0A7L5DMS9_9BACT|nr:type II toxin-antitoxin system VapC family toxin [Spirosoma rhododendri]QJD79784.1 type II toxin-antitoxin system VapC family toxin [Spirosoma rhododendri]
MEDKLILVDTSILIDFFRKTDKSNSALISLVRRGYSYCISAVTEYEIYIGATPAQIDFWNGFLDRTTVLPFDKLTANVAVDLTRTLKQNRNLIDIADLFIAATAIANNLPCATLNRKHFERITGLRMVN